ncbi:hypothetical protein K1T71_006740 [Dendrolimus kikuchii]|uniref:Uncharacterized protein n=1 Tax=Dendrolimus kikuchii TaxID=765133 RepID=A0ACC1D2V3_9NEOP|nr:hypothetical protein K1T71_006740 [Dendrolimus kikuchii]
MGNTKSKKVKISQNEPPNNEEKNNERINSIKTEIAGADLIRNIKDDGEDLDQNKDRDHDNASSASTVEGTIFLLLANWDGSNRIERDKPDEIMKIVTLTCIIFIFINEMGNAVARSKKQPADKIKLYYFFISPPCRAVMLTARMLGIEFELISVNLLTGEHLTPEYLKINPQHTVPTIDDNGFILWESRAIMTYLISAYGKNDDLYPKNARIRALVDQRLQFDLATFFTRWHALYMPMFMGGEYDDEKAAKLKEALDWLNAFLDSRVFVAGDNFTVADISMVVTMTNIQAFGFEYKELENVVKWFERSKKILEPYGYKEIDEAAAEVLAANLPE